MFFFFLSSPCLFFLSTVLFPTSRRNMSENPLQCLFQNMGRLCNSIHAHLSNNVNPSNNPESPLLSVSSSKASAVPRDRDFLLNKAKASAPVTKEELGRSTWTFLHTLAAQYPDNPTRQQKRDVKELMAILSRMYPCQECADHFKEVLRTNPVQAGSHADFSQWLCYVHNVVNRSLGKPVFPCERVDARWGKLDCEHRACDLQGAVPILDGKPFL